MKKHYDVLGLSSKATEEEVKNAYRDLSKKYHPDLCVAVSKEIAEEKFKEINEAYINIKNHIKKANEISELKEVSTKNTKNNTDIDIIYSLVQRYITEDQLNITSFKFPNEDTLNFYEKDNYTVVEGYYYSNNGLKQKIKTNYRISLFKNFKLNKLEFLETEEVKEKKKKSTRKTYNFRKKNKEFVLGIKHLLTAAFIILLLWILLAQKG